MAMLNNQRVTGGIKTTQQQNKNWLVVTGTWLDDECPETVGNFIIPTDELIFFRGVETTNQKSKAGSGYGRYSMIHVSFLGNPPYFIGENHGFLQNGAPKIAKLRCKVAEFYGLW